MGDKRQAMLPPWHEFSRTLINLTKRRGEGRGEIEPHPTRLVEQRFRPHPASANPLIAFTTLISSIRIVPRKIDILFNFSSRNKASNALRFDHS